MSNTLSDAAKAVVEYYKNHGYERIFHYLNELEKALQSETLSKMVEENQTIGLYEEVTGVEGVDWHWMPSGGFEKGAMIKVAIPKVPKQEKDEKVYTHKEAWDMTIETLKHYVPKHEFNKVYDAHIHYVKEILEHEKKHSSLKEQITELETENRYLKDVLLKEAEYLFRNRKLSAAELITIQEKLK